MYPTEADFASLEAEIRLLKARLNQLPAKAKPAPAPKPTAFELTRSATRFEQGQFNAKAFWRKSSDGSFNAKNFWK